MSVGVRRRGERFHTDGPVCIHGGAITQLEQREMPAILRNARAAAELCGVRCFLEVKPMSFYDFYQRFAIELDAD